jgi:PAS domain S-box-containing protein
MDGGNSSAGVAPAAGAADPFASPDTDMKLALLAAIVESSDDAIVSKTLEGCILSWNAGATRIFGYEAAEVIGKPITIIIPPELHDEERHILEQVRGGRRIDHFDTVRVAKDGRRVDISLTVSPVRDARGVIIGASKVARDITERKRAEQALRDADRRKDEFLAMLAHELRNPLAPIRYALAAAKISGRSAEQRKRAEEVVERQVAHMSRLLDDLLDVSLVTRGTLVLKKGRTELTSVIGTAIETARPLIDAKQHRLSLELPTQPVQLEADAVRLSQVFANLLINAAKYTDPGGDIRLRATQLPNEVLVAVRDNGIGIPHAVMPRLFTLFEQADPSGARTQGGLGVGLALVRGLVALHGGAVTAKSEGAGRGSEFTVRLPIGLAMSDPADEALCAGDDPSGAPCRVLVVDDSRDAADTCATLLELSGHRVQKAYSGRRALEVGGIFHPQVLLMDIGLPDVDGYQLARTIRASSWGRDILLIAVTGWGQEADRRRALEAGFDHHLTKPAAAEALDALLRAHRAGPARASAQSAQ